LAAFSAMFAISLATQAPAQQGATAQSGGPALEEIVVTARKQTERLLDAPLSITAFSADDIAEKGFKDLEDVARSAPGVQYSAQGGQIPGRYNSAIRFRGMNVNSDSPSLQLGALFVDGVYVLGGTQSIPIDDVERIEVIKGPQAALYGRSTFGGAINYITRKPSLTDYSGRLSATAANFGESDISASFEGPIVSDKLAFRVGGRFYSRGRVFTATDGGALGEESSKTVSLALLAKPIDALTIEFRGFYGLDEDGPAAGGMVQGWRNDSCTGQTIATQDPVTPLAHPRNYVCGAVPEQGQAISALNNTRIIDSTTSLFPLQAALNGVPSFVYDRLAAQPNDPRISVPAIDHVGLIRDLSRFSLSGTYEFAGGYQATAVAAVNQLAANWIRPFGLTQPAIWWSRDPTDSKDESYEIRFSSPSDRRLSWLAGVNYYDQTFLQSGSGGDSIWLCANFSPFVPVGSPCSRVSLLFPNSLAQNTDKVTTQGLFASVNYKFTDQWSVSLEGRYQKDETTKAILTASPTKIEDTSFLPRAILRFQPTPETNIYTSYARGLLPGAINGEVSQATPRELAQYQALQPGLPGIVEGDKIDMFELGWKQQFWDRRAQVSLAAYYAKWESQKGRSAFQIQEDCGSFAHGGVSGAIASQGCPNGATGLPAVLNGLPYKNTRNAVVPGSSKLRGLEFEGAARLTDRWDVRGTMTYAKSEYDQFLFNFVLPIAGFSEMKGNSNARFPEWSGNLYSGYEAPVANSDWSWFVNGDLSYVGKTFVDESNLAYCKAYTLGNLRAGGTKDNLRIEGFVKNVFDDDSWTACARWTDFDSAPTLNQLTQYQGIAVSPQTPRQYGIRVSIKF